MDKIERIVKETNSVWKAQADREFWRSRSELYSVLLVITSIVGSVGTYHLYMKMKMLCDLPTPLPPSTIIGAGVIVMITGGMWIFTINMVYKKAKKASMMFGAFSALLAMHAEAQRKHKKKIVDAIQSTSREGSE